LKIENDEMEDNTDIEKEYLISDLDELKKSSEENKSLKIELIKKKESLQSFEESQKVIENLRDKLEESRKVEKTQMKRSVWNPK
jgi:hypothetical protein